MTNLLFTWKPPFSLDRIQNAVEGLKVQVSDDPAEILKLLPDAEIVCVANWNAEMLRVAKKLRWVQAFSGGINGLLFPEFVVSPIPLTSLKGNFSLPAAEYAMGVMLAFSRRLEYDIRQRPQRTFVASEPTELYGKTVGIVGLGSMGVEIAKRCRCFQMKVLAMASQPRKDVDLVDQWYPSDRLVQLLAASDYIVVAVPLTKLTHGMIGEHELTTMKPSAYLIDVSGRPAIYDLTALTRALQSRRIAGASLQMVPEVNSPLWDLDNLILSFHRTVSREQMERSIETFCENLRRYSRGETLLGLVDKQAGY